MVVANQISVPSTLLFVNTEAVVVVARSDRTFFTKIKEIHLFKGCYLQYVQQLTSTYTALLMLSVIHTYYRFLCAVFSGISCLSFK